jgi:hypothetical protein
MQWLPKCRHLPKKQKNYSGLIGTGLPTMNVADFEDLLDRLGDDMSTWPAPQRQSAADLLRSSDQAGLLLDEARRLRRALSAAPVRATAGLTDRILRAVPAVPKPAVTPIRLSRRWNGSLAFLVSPRSPGLILAVCFLIGIFVGLFPSLLPDQSSRIDFPGFLAYAMDISRVTE